MAQTSKTTENKTVSSEKKSRAVPVIVVLSMLLVMALGTAGYLYYRYAYIPQKNTESEVKTLTREIGRFMELPAGEPTLATVTDKEKLAEQPFFQKAENGDKVLIYADAGRAILYRPSTMKIVDVTTVNVKAPETAATPEANIAPAPPTENTPVVEATSVTIALYNGSTKVGVTNTLEGEIKAAFPDSIVTIKEKAAKTDYQGNLVIDLSGKNADLAKKLADSIGGSVGTMPDGEAAPSADILIIVGNK